ncbi:hypothetical protein LCGC14_0798500 [marine sediment metagenome]|uniref:Transmembrane protein n=1 Tax=marine sediment metagenome TaxID=412755 RepID=A0A0F9SXK2_9ZZZZ
MRVALFTNRDHIKPMLWGIALVVMPLLCWLAAVVAKEGGCSWQCATPDSKPYGHSSIILVWVLCAITFAGGLVLFCGSMTFHYLSSTDLPFCCRIIPPMAILRCFCSFVTLLCGLTFFAGFVTLSGNSTFFCSRVTFLTSLTSLTSLISTRTCFARCFETALFSAVPAKFTQWFVLLAFRAGLCYDAVSHVLFLCKRLWLKPYVEPTSTCGLFTIHNPWTKARDIYAR